WTASRKAQGRVGPQTCLKTRRGAHRPCNAADGRQIAFAGRAGTSGVLIEIVVDARQLLNELRRSNHVFGASDRRLASRDRANCFAFAGILVVTRSCGDLRFMRDFDSASGSCAAARAPRNVLGVVQPATVAGGI